MLPDRVSNPGPLTYESGDLPIALRGPAQLSRYKILSGNVIKDRYICTADVYEQGKDWF